ncbi:MAG: hypothetical protein IIV28_04050, partial [Alistipes sp.]|nr:hypothetical protein [Alistipes sp.]
MLLSALLSIPAVQNFAVDRLTAFASRKLKTEVSIGHIDVSYTGHLHVDDFYVEDYQQDTLLYVSHLKGFLPGLGLSEGGLRFAHGHIDGGKLYLKETPEGEMNIKQVVNAFSDPNREKKGRFHLEIEDASIRGMELVIEQQEHRNPSYGVDYGNMRIHNIGVEVNHFGIDGHVIAMDIDKLRFREESGFVLDELSGQFALSTGCLGFENARLRTPQSDLRIASLAIVGDSWKTYKYFISEVEMDVEIPSGVLSTDDIAYFAPRMQQWKTRFSDIDATFRGTVDDFEAEINSLRANDKTFLRGTGRVKGIPEVRRSRFDVQLAELRTTATEAT